MPKKKRELSAFEVKLNNFVANFSRISLAQKIFFVDHLRTMIKAGLSLVEGLDILSKQMSNQKFKNITAKIKAEVETGKPLSEVLAKYPRVFPSMYVQMVASGEVAGTLEESLEQVVIQMKKSHELIASIRGAMIYPAVIMVAMGGVGILMTTVVLPKLLEIFKDFDAELPLATRILIIIVDFVSKPINLILIFIVLISIVSGFIYLMRNSLPFKRFVHGVYLHIPIIGGVIRQINLAKFSLTLSSLLSSTIPIIDAVDITAETCSNLRFREALHDSAKKIKSGEPFSEILRQHDDLFPPMVTEMVMVGERSGEVEHLLHELAEFYGDKVDRTMKNFSTVIEPIIILALGLAVAGLAVAVVMPMFSLVQNF